MKSIPDCWLTWPIQEHVLSLSEAFMNTRDQKPTKNLLGKLGIKKGLVDTQFNKPMNIISDIHSSGKEEVNCTVTTGFCWVQDIIIFMRQEKTLADLNDLVWHCFNSVRYKEKKNQTMDSICLTWKQMWQYLCHARIPGDRTDKKPNAVLIRLCWD